MKSAEKKNALKAVSVINKAGGKITFRQYDKTMFNEKYFIPLSWGVIGHGLPRPLFKKNMDKLCVFTACQLGLAEQTTTGYVVTENQHTDISCQS